MANKASVSSTDGLTPGPCGLTDDNSHKEDICGEWAVIKFSRIVKETR